MAGKYFDDWVIGEQYVTPGRTVTETDVVMFAAMTGDYNEIHMSKEFAKDSHFGERIVHGLLGLSISHGLLFRLGFLEGVGIAFLTIESWEFKAPILFGDTLRVKVRVEGKRPSRSKPDRGILKLFLQLVNQDDTVVQEGTKTLMIKRRVQLEESGAPDRRPYDL